MDATTRPALGRTSGRPGLVSVVDLVPFLVGLNIGRDGVGAGWPGEVADAIAAFRQGLGLEVGQAGGCDPAWSGRPWTSWRRGSEPGDGGWRLLLDQRAKARADRRLVRELGVMSGESQPPSAGGMARQSADRLALALEEVGFDVGRAFPMLGAGIDSRGGPGVELGRVAAAVADRLSMVLTEAVRYGVTAAAEGDWPDAGEHDPAGGN